MSAHTLALIYQAAEIDRISDPYWIRIEPVGQEPETATVSQAAGLLDALYQIDPCTAGEPQGELVEPEDFAPTVAAAIDLAYCRQAYDGSVEMQIRVIRSHLAEPYRLQLQGGELIRTLRVSEQVTRTLEISGQTTLDYPVVSGFACSPEPLARVGNTLLFAAELDGHTLRASYQTRYDLATIKVLGVDGEPGECRALAFHHGLVADETLTPPPAEAVDRSLCPDSDYQAPMDDEVTCYQVVEIHRVCSCSKHEVETITHEEIVPCPSEMHCGNNETRCMHLLGTVSATTYVTCGDEDRSGDFNGNLSDQEFYFDKCCEWPRRDLPQCVTEHRTYRGDRQIEHGLAHYRALYGDLARIVPVSPPGGICGDWTIEQRLMGNNCCDGVSSLAWNWSESAEVVAANGTATVGVLGGGKFPYEWIIVGDGFWLGSGKKRITTSVPWVTVYGMGACGSADIYVSDGCSQTKGSIRSTNGRWQHRWDGYPHCLEDPAGAGFFQCSAYIAAFPSGHSGQVRGRWWYGLYSSDPPAEEAITAFRISHTCGLWAKGSCSGDWFVTVPGTDGAVRLPALVVYGVANCVAAGGTVSACLYHFIDHLKVMEWVC